MMRGNIMATLLARRFSSSAIVRGWRELLGWGTSQPKPVLPSHESRGTPPTVSPTEHLKHLTQTLVPEYTGEWKQVPLDNTLKSKILLSCESTFNLKVANTKLGSLQTVGDILKLLQAKPPKSAPSIFPNIVRDKLPPNLSIQYGAHAKPKHVQRSLFQNYEFPKQAKIGSKIKYKQV